MYIEEIAWQHYQNLPHIARLPLNEQIRMYNMYLMDVSEQRINYLRLQEAITQQETIAIAVAASSGGGGGDIQQEQSDLPSGCIEFVNNTSDGTGCQFWIETSAPTNYTITWGDGETTTGETTADGDGGVGTGDGGNKLEVVYDYANSDTEYTARICFDDISLVTYLEFNGDD
jgi:hypothetical protein